MAAHVLSRRRGRQWLKKKLFVRRWQIPQTRRKHVSCSPHEITCNLRIRWEREGRGMRAKENESDRHGLEPGRARRIQYHNHHQPLLSLDKKQTKTTFKKNSYKIEYIVWASVRLLKPVSAFNNRNECSDGGFSVWSGCILVIKGD